MNSTEVNFTLKPYSEDIADALIAELGHIGYNGFCNTDNGLLAYILAADFNEDSLKSLEIISFFAPHYQITWTHTEIEDQDWNKVWEDNFTPIVVDNRILVRAGFHDTIEGIEHEIIIEPKMSFGTGHHSTTALMLASILCHTNTIKGKRVLDMGCGTGILSIMAAKAGAAEVTGIDIDEWAFNNAMENMKNNHITNIKIKIGDAGLLKNEEPFDIILANINRNILLNDMHHYTEKLRSQGCLIMSGFYEQDLPMIKEKAESLGLDYQEYKEDKNWVAVSFYKK